ncbi:hypothetical protein LCGC14_0396560 [marine sediment metagenome]|uniref:Uncharacterized protein n=1 Tax=marine sediment metagenome TaxID=412755 RepID=A0A0F9T3X3_9ZZZZ
MTITKLFKKHLKQAIRDGYDHTKINCIAGCTERKLTLSEAEGEAGKRTYSMFMQEKLWNDTEMDARPGWLFGSPKTMLNIGLVPIELRDKRLGLNQHNWDSYKQIT